MRRIVLRGRMERIWVRVLLACWLAFRIGYELLRELGLQSVAAFLVGYLVISPIISFWYADEIMDRLAHDAKETLNIRVDARVERLGNRLLQASGLTNGSVEFGLCDVRGEYYNGYYVWPNYVGVTAPALEETEEEEVLGVLAHELGHMQLGRNPLLRRMIVVVKVFAFRLGSMGKWAGELLQIERLFRHCEHYVLGFASRMLEAKADQKGFEFLVKSGLAIAGPALFFHRELSTFDMRTLHEKLIATHPSIEERFYRSLDRMEAVAHHQVRVKGTEIYVRDQLFVQVDVGRLHASERIALIIAGKLIIAVRNEEMFIRPECGEPVKVGTNYRGDYTELMSRLILKNRENNLPNLEFFAGY